jgi:hypothetical protein
MGGITARPARRQLRNVPRISIGCDSNQTDAPNSMSASLPANVPADRQQRRERTEQAELPVHY